MVRNSAEEPFFQTENMPRNTVHLQSVKHERRFQEEAVALRKEACLTSEKW